MVKWSWWEWVLFIATLYGFFYGAWSVLSAEPPYDYIQAVLGWWMIFIAILLWVLMFTPKAYGGLAMVDLEEKYGENKQ